MSLVVVDDLIPHCPNLVAGANEEGYHLLNVNYGRDYCQHRLRIAPAERVIAVRSATGC